MKRLWIRMQNMHRTDKRKAFNPKYWWCSQRIRTLVNIGLQIFSLLCSNLFYNASFKNFIRTSTPPITKFALVRTKGVWGQPSMPMIFPKADRWRSSKFATGLNKYPNCVFHIYPHCLKLNIYDWRKTEPVTIKANFFHFWFSQK